MVDKKWIALGVIGVIALIVVIVLTTTSSEKFQTVTSCSACSTLYSDSIYSGQCKDRQGKVGKCLKVRCPNNPDSICKCCVPNKK